MTVNKPDREAAFRWRPVSPPRKKVWPPEDPRILEDELVQLALDSKAKMGFLERFGLISWVTERYRPW